MTYYSVESLHQRQYIPKPHIRAPMIFPEETLIKKGGLLNNIIDIMF